MCHEEFSMTRNSMPYVTICAVHTTAGKDINIVRPSLPSVSNQSTKKKKHPICVGISESGVNSVLTVLQVLLQ